MISKFVFAAWEGVSIVNALLGPNESGQIPSRTSREDEHGASTYRTVVQSATQESYWVGQKQLDSETPGFATSLDLESNQINSQADNLAGVLRQVAGLRVRTLGGLGQYSSISIRGSSAKQVRVFYDGIPIDTGMAGLADLSDQSMDALGKIEVYRGFVPVLFGGASLGGAVNLIGKIHRGPQKVAANVGFGSFMTREAKLSLAQPLGSHHGFAARVGYAGTQGNFRYFDHGNTPYLQSDDRTVRRQNNGYDRVQGQFRFDGKKNGWRWSPQLILYWKKQGVPGPGYRQSTKSQQEAGQFRLMTRVDKSGWDLNGYRLTWVAGLAGQWRHYVDPLGQVGIARDDEQSLTFDGYLSPRLRVNLWRGAHVGISADARGERIDVDERDAPVEAEVLASGDAVRHRASLGAGVQLEQSLWKRRVELVGGLRVDSFMSQFEVPPGEGEVGDEGANQVQVGMSPRFGLKVQAHEYLELRSSIGRYFRAPTLMELFGDRGFAVGNEGLVAESGYSIDGGVVFNYEFEPWIATYLSAAWFFTRSRDWIQWVQSGPVVRPINLPGAWIHGVEVSSRWSSWADRLSSEFSYTWLDSRNRSPEREQFNKALPGRPRHDFYAKLRVGDRMMIASHQLAIGGSYTLTYSSGTFLDPSGRLPIPRRILHGVGLEIEFDRKYMLGFDLRNLNDARTMSVNPIAGTGQPYRVAVSDFLGFPLPGRSFWINFRVEFEMTRNKKTPSS